MKQNLISSAFKTCVVCFEQTFLCLGFSMMYRKEVCAMVTHKN